MFEAGEGSIPWEKFRKLALQNQYRVLTARERLQELMLDRPCEGFAARVQPHVRGGGQPSANLKVFV